MLVAEVNVALPPKRLEMFAAAKVDEPETKRLVLVALVVVPFVVVRLVRMAVAACRTLAKSEVDVALVVVPFVPLKLLAVSVVKNAERAERNEENRPAVVVVPVMVEEAAVRLPVRFSFVPEEFEKENAPLMLRLVVVADVNVAVPPLRFEMFAAARVDEPET